MHNVPQYPCLRFGIPSLDDLFGSFSLSHRAHGIPMSKDHFGKLSIIGPEGSGKSILALHLASRYAADVLTRERARHKKPLTKVIYISTDFTHVKANQMWEVFKLNRPNLREVPFYRPMVASKDTVSIKPEHVGVKAVLSNLDPLAEKGEPTLVRYLLSDAASSDGVLEIAFLDLISHPAGDGWAMVARLLGSLKPVASADQDDQDPDQHLVIVDNVDGFEVMGGSRNAFGDESSVRARIMQTVYAASGKAHVVFVGEEKGPGSQPLNEVSDVVLQLAFKEDAGYRFRVVEIRKARAQAVHRGDHHFLIRTGAGSTTGLQENPDDPRTANAYIQVIPSLHTVSRRVMNEPTELLSIRPLRDKRRAGSGLHYLDELCGASTSETLLKEDPTVLKVDTTGLRFGTLTAILGDANTYKSPLAHQFLERGFELFTEQVGYLFENWDGQEPLAKSNKPKELLEKVHQAREARKKWTDEREQRQDGGKAHSLKSRFKKVDPDRLSECLAEILLYDRHGFEESATVEGVKSWIEKKKLPPALTVLLGQWTRRIYANALREALPSDTKKVQGLTRPAFLKENDSLLHRFLDKKNNQKIKGRQIVQDAVRGSVGKFKRLPGIDFEYYEEILTDLHEAKLSKAEIASKIAREPDFIPTKDGPFPRLAETKAEAGAKKKYIERRTKYWLGKEAHEFLRRWFPGSVDRISEEQRRQLSKKLSKTTISQEMLFHLLVGHAISNLDKRTQEGLTEAHNLCSWFRKARIPGLKDLSESPRAQGLSTALLACLKAVGSRADVIVVSKILSNHAKKRKLDGFTPNDLKSLLPQVVSKVDFDPPDTPDKRDIATAFSLWLFGRSPKTHPYALEEGSAALDKEIHSLLQKEKRDYPVLRAVLVSGVLQLVRAGHLVMKSHLEVELNARQRATESLDALRDWMNNCFQPDNKGCWKKLNELLKAIEESKLAEKHLSALVKMVSEEEGFYGKVEDLWSERLDAKTRMRVCRMIVEAACREGLMDGPAILITTNDVRFDTLRMRFDRWLEDRWKAYDPETARLLMEEGRRHLRDWLVIRRLEIHYLPTATLAMQIRQSVEVAQSLLFQTQGKQNSTEWETDVNIRRDLSWNIRLVIDGLASLKQTYPNIIQDSLFLHGLRFFLGRENLTAIMVSTQTGRPDAAGDDTFEKETLNLFLQQIRTWRVQFLGEMRVAVTCLPPAPEHGTARVREITSRARGKLEVNPHFELYCGLETGQVQRVPLEIRLADNTRALEPYRSALNTVFGDVFLPAAVGPDGKPQVVVAETSLGWTEKLRDFGRLHRESHLNHTLVLEVDECWSFQRPGAVRNQWQYLGSSALTEPGTNPNDPLEVFQPTLADHGEPPSLRYDRFEWQGYFAKSSRGLSKQEQEAIDRVPFMWDFGFLLCNKHAWQEALGQKLTISNINEGKGEKDTIRVQAIWDAIPKIEGDKIKLSSTETKPSRTKVTREIPSWRNFLEAAMVVASHHSLSESKPAVAFDLPVRGGESLSCLVLEMWASEVYAKYRSPSSDPGLLSTYFDRFSTRSWLPCQTRGIIGLIAEPRSKGRLKTLYHQALAKGQLPVLERHSLELFKTLVLLREALDISSFVDYSDPFVLKSHPVHPGAVAARHWYGTACEFLDHAEGSTPFVPVRLPGHFSVRGDRYLTVAQGSQSSLLADRALDLLSSRRGNFERLRVGLGLPVREIGDVESGSPRTRLPTVHNNGRRDRIRYNTLTQIGAVEDGDKHFRWLWRSSLGDYDAQARAFQQGVLWFVNWWNTLRRIPGTGWRTGFDLYDALVRYSESKNPKEKREIFAANFQINSLWEFGELCDELVNNLENATPRRPRIYPPI